MGHETGMSPKRYLNWPFFESSHRELEAALQAWAQQQLAEMAAGDIDSACRQLVKQLGKAGWLRHAVGGKSYGGASDAIDTRAVCLIRETLARHHTLADFAFAMQGLGSAAIALFGSEEQKQAYLPRVAQGDAIAAFALSEPEAGSDAAALQCSARCEGDDWVLNGEKTWISNGGIADFYIVFARSEPTPGAKGISAYIVDANTQGLEVLERISLMSPHPMAKLVFRDCRIPLHSLIGDAGQGFRIAMATLDVFRPSVAAAALGMAKRALGAAAEHALQRKLFGQALADLQATQIRLADMATSLDASALLTYRAAWERDQGLSVTAEAAMAKLHATETAQKIVDDALQLFGAAGVVSGHPLEQLYREVRALRIYEGASEIQQLIIARQLLRERKP